MPSVTALRYRLTTSPKPGVVSLHLDLKTTRASAGDYLSLALSISTAIKDAVEAAFAQVGASIEMDLGDGALTALMLSEIGSPIQINESLDGYGSTMSFVLDGPDRSPLRSALLRGMRAVRLTGYLGKPGAVVAKRLFDGFIRSATFDAYPASCQIQCNDTSLKYAGRKLAYNLAPGSFRTRKDVLIEILNQESIPYGVLDLGPDNGGRVFKAMTFGGDRGVLDSIQEFVSPTGRRIRFRNGLLEVLPFDGSLPVQRTIHAGHIGNLRITPPPTDEANQVVVSATVYGYIGPTGHRTEYKVVSTRGVYAPAVALRKQDHSSGNITDIALTSNAVDREVSRVETWTEYDGGTVVGQTVTEWGWYAPRACASQQVGGADASLKWNGVFDVYKFADGSWRSEPAEKFRIIRHSVLARSFDPNIGTLAQEVTRIRRFLPQVTRIGAFTDNTGAQSFDADVFIAQDGQGWKDGWEIFGDEPSDVVTTGYLLGYVDTSLRIVRKDTVTIVNAFAGPTLLLGYPAYSPIHDFAAWGILGPSAAKRYALLYFPDIGGAPPRYVEAGQTVTYGFVDEQNYRLTVSDLLPLIANKDSIEALALLPKIQFGSSIVQGVIPMPDRLTSQQSAQSATQTVMDQVRVDLNGAVKDPRQNDYCETVTELKTVAIEILREHGAVLVDFDMPFDCLTRAGHTVAVDIPELGGEVQLVVWSSDATVGASGETNQHLSCRWYPPELAAVA